MAAHAAGWRPSWAGFSAKRRDRGAESQSSLFKGLRRHFQVTVTLNLGVEVRPRIAASTSGGFRIQRARLLSTPSFQPAWRLLCAAPAVLAPQASVLGFDPMLHLPPGHQEWPFRSTSDRYIRPPGFRKVERKIMEALIALGVGLSPCRHGRACPTAVHAGNASKTGPHRAAAAKFYRHKAFALAALTNIRCAEPRG